MYVCQLNNQDHIINIDIYIDNNNKIIPTMATTTMQAEHPQPLYTPISFLLTQTIGQSTPNTNSNTGSQPQSLLHIAPQYRYQDILIPRSVRSVGLVYLYYMFHVPPVYNWLRGMTVVGGTAATGCFQRNCLQDYLDSTTAVTPANKNASLTAHKKITSASTSTSTSSTSISPPHPESLKQTLQSLLPKYQILKQCLSSKIYIIKPSPTSTSISISTSNSNTSTSQTCKHNIKLSVYTTDYYYNQEQSTLGINGYYCKECERGINVRDGDYVVEGYPYAPIFNQYYGHNIHIKHQSKPTPTQTPTPTLTNYINTNTTNTTNTTISFPYTLTQIHTHKFILIQAANGLWYKADYILNTQQQQQQPSSGYILGEFAICGGAEISRIFQQAAHKNWKGLCVYVSQDIVTNCGMLRIAAQLQDTRVNKDQFIKPHPQVERQQVKVERTPKPKILPTNSNSDPPPQQIQQQLQELPADSHPINKILLPQNLGEIGNKYKEQVEKLYLKPKQKDEYERDYDKGKTKKIKKKIEYIKPNFNEIFKVVKKENQELIDGLREPEKKNRRVFRKSKEGQGDANANINGEGNGDGNNGGQGKKEGGFKKFGGGRGGKGGQNRKFGGGKFGQGRKQFKKWKKQRKEQFVKKFQQS